MISFWFLNQITAIAEVWVPMYYETEMRVQTHISVLAHNNDKEKGRIQKDLLTLEQQF